MYASPFDTLLIELQRKKLGGSIIVPFTLIIIDPGIMKEAEILLNLYRMTPSLLSSISNFLIFWGSAFCPCSFFPLFAFINRIQTLSIFYIFDYRLGRTRFPWISFHCLWNQLLLQFLKNLILPEIRLPFSPEYVSTVIFSNCFILKL